MFPVGAWGEQMSLMRHVEQQILSAENGGERFFKIKDFPWAKDIEQAWVGMRKEMDLILLALDLLPAFGEIRIQEKRHSADKRWKIFPLYAYGHWVLENTVRCPNTTAALKGIPGLQAAMFSILRAGKELELHRGPYNGVLRYHLGLKIPKPEIQCGISVGGEIRNWYEGASLIFDDSHLHEAWNRSSEDRVVLFVDFTRPLSGELRKLNDEVIENIYKSDWVTQSAKRWGDWESIFGREFDRLIATNA